jgi:two-component system, OmpR family, sensor histidine kinase BaeS
VLRLYVTIFCVVLGLMLILVGVHLTSRRRKWLLRSATILTLGVAWGMNVANPEAIVARENLGRTAGTFDSSYLARLSHDAAPTIADHSVRLAQPERTQLLNAFCGESGQDSQSWSGYNLSRAHADQARRRICR